MKVKDNSRQMLIPMKTRQTVFRCQHSAEYLQLSFMRATMPVLLFFYSNPVTLMVWN